MKVLQKLNVLFVAALIAMMAMLFIMAFGDCLLGLFDM